MRHENKLRPAAGILADEQRAASLRSFGLHARNLTTHCGNDGRVAAGGCGLSDAYVRALVSANAREAAV